MEKIDKNMNKRVEDLTINSVVMLLEQWDLMEFVDFVREKQLDGRKLMNITEGIVKLWRPKSNANNLIAFVNDLKNNPDKYIERTKLVTDKANNNSNRIDDLTNETTHIKILTINSVELESKASVEAIESQYQTVKKTKDNNLSAFNNVEELIKKIVPAKSFLYRNQGKKETAPAYLPMDAGTHKKKKMFRISGYDYPMFDLRRFSKHDSGDRGYYPMQRNSTFFAQKPKVPESRSKYKSLSSTEELKYPEDHFYEDLCYNEVENEARHSVPSQNVKPYRVKIQELFQSFKMPFFKRSEEVIPEDKSAGVSEKENNFYENNDGIANMYDSVHVNTPVEEQNKPTEKPKLPVEEYLEPVQLSKDYCDVTYQRPKDESLLGYIMSIFENRFGIRRGVQPKARIAIERQPVSGHALKKNLMIFMVDIPYVRTKRFESTFFILTAKLWNSLPKSVFPDKYNIGVFKSRVNRFFLETNESANSEDSEDDKTNDEVRRWNVDQSTSMADRPLPVPVENEPYYMDIDRTEAENLLKGQLDGTFVLRPSSQPNHAYTVSVACSGGVHNVGVRRRPDARLALGFARRGERSFADVTSLLRHHRKRRLLLVANGSVIGATTLNESPQYYQTPCNIPVKVHM